MYTLYGRICLQIRGLPADFIPYESNHYLKKVELTYNATTVPSPRKQQPIIAKYLYVHAQ